MAKYVPPSNLSTIEEVTAELQKVAAALNTQLDKQDPATGEPTNELQSNLDFNNHKILNALLPNGDSIDDIINYRYVGTVNGRVPDEFGDVDQTPDVLLLNASDEQSVQTTTNFSNVNVPTPTQLTHPTDKAYVDDADAKLRDDITNIIATGAINGGCYYGSEETIADTTQYANDVGLNDGDSLVPWNASYEGLYFYVVEDGKFGAIDVTVNDIIYSDNTKWVHQAGRGGATNAVLTTGGQVVNGTKRWIDVQRFGDITTDNGRVDLASTSTVAKFSGIQWRESFTTTNAGDMRFGQSGTKLNYMQVHDGSGWNALFQYHQDVGTLVFGKQISTCAINNASSVTLKAPNNEGTSQEEDDFVLYSSNTGTASIARFNGTARVPLLTFELDNSITVTGSAPAFRGNTPSDSDDKAFTTVDFVKDQIANSGAGDHVTFRIIGQSYDGVCETEGLPAGWVVTRTRTAHYSVQHNLGFKVYGTAIPFGFASCCIENDAAITDMFTEFVQYVPYSNWATNGDLIVTMYVKDVTA